MASSKQALTEQLETRAKAFVSDPDLVTPAVLSLAMDEALKLAGEASPDPVIVDIAYHRLLLQLGMGMDEDALKAYKLALNQVTDSSAAASPIAKPKAKQRPNPYL